MSSSAVEVQDAEPEEVGSDEEVDESVGLEEILFQYREVILDLDRRVGDLERRPTFAAAVKGKKTRL